MPNTLIIENPEQEINARVKYLTDAINDRFTEQVALRNSLKEYIEKWANHLDSRKASNNTILTYLTHITFLLEFLEKKKFTTLDIKPADAQEMIDGIEGGIIVKNTALYAARSFYNFLGLFELGHITKNPFMMIQAIKMPTKVPKPLTEDELKKVYDAIYTMRFDTESVIKAFVSDFELLPFLLLINTGMRTFELFKLRFQDFELVEDIIEGRTIETLYVTIKGKGGHERRTPIVDVYNIWERFFADREKVDGRRVGDLTEFFWEKFKMTERLASREERMRTAIVFPNITRNILYGLLKLINKVNNTKVTLHKFRHTYATFLLSQDMPLHQVMKILGHKSPTTTMMYAAVVTKDIQRSLEKIKRYGKE